MGTDLRGKNIGKGITQRKDKKYYARITLKSGKVSGKLFDNLAEAKKWVIDKTYEDRHYDISANEDMAVDAWFNYWIENVKRKTIKLSTYDNYQNKYRLYIKDCIGNMLLSDIKLMHCQNIVNQLYDKGLSIRTIKLVKVILHDLFEYALMNSMISTNPINKNLKIPKEQKEEPRVLNIKEERMLLDFKHDTENGDIYAFILQTGLRFGEIMALQWTDIDYERKCIILKNNAYYDEKSKEYIFYSPKSESGIRNVPLTKKALEILSHRKEKVSKLQVIDYRYSNCVFLNEKGTLSAASRYNKDLKKVAKNLQCEPFSLHSLRHTFATRCIEAGMKPKTLQKILGHANISVTMNLYVHVTEDERNNEMNKFEEYDNYTQSVINL